MRIIREVQIHGLSNGNWIVVGSVEYEADSQEKMDEVFEQLHILLHQGVIKNNKSSTFMFGDKPGFVIRLDRFDAFRIQYV